MSHQERNRWIIRRSDRNDARLRLFCFPYAGAGAAIFHRWLDSFPEYIDVCAIEPPGRLARLRDPAPDSIANFVTEFDAIAADLLDRPFAVFGYSLGAIFAFEWARHVRRTSKREPERLIVAACGAPQIVRASEPISQLPAGVFVDQLERRYGALDPSMRSDPEMLDLIVQIMRNDLRLLENYRYSVELPLTCPILALGGTHDPRISAPLLERWREHTRSDFRVEMIPGDHFFLRTRPAQLEAAVRGALDQADQSLGARAKSDVLRGDVARVAF